MRYLILLLFTLTCTTEAESVYKFTNGQGNIEFSSEKPPLGIAFETIDMETHETASASPPPAPMSVIPPGIPVAEPPSVMPPTVQNVPNPSASPAPPPSSPQPEDQRYQQVRKDLYEICNHLTYGSLERRKCRADAKQIFHDKCHDKDTPVSELYRRAYCSLSDSYPIVE